MRAADAAAAAPSTQLQLAAVHGTHQAGLKRHCPAARLFFRRGASIGGPRPHHLRAVGAARRHAVHAALLLRLRRGKRLGGG